MKNFHVPEREQVSPANQLIFDSLNKALGFVPNLFAIFAHSDTALADYLSLQNRKSSLNGQEREIINLVTSEINNCQYCLSAHTTLGKMKGLTEEQTLEIRSGHSSINSKYNALAKVVKSIVINRGRPTTLLVENFYAAGYTQENLIDVSIIIGDKIITNYLHNITQIPVDFPLALPLTSTEAQYA
jgi:AhpD family alkylhydroperoxidase